MTIELSNSEKRVHIWFEGPKKLWENFPPVTEKEYWELTVRPAFTCDRLFLARAVLAVATTLAEPGPFRWKGWLVTPEGTLDSGGRYRTALQEIFKQKESNHLPYDYTFVFHGKYARETAYFAALILIQAEGPRRYRIPATYELQEVLPLLPDKSQGEMLTFIETMQLIAKTGELSYHSHGKKLYLKKQMKERILRRTRMKRKIKRILESGEGDLLGIRRDAESF